jgi:hypothetical protein
MSKRRILKLFETNGRSKSGLAWYCRVSFIANQHVFLLRRSSNRPVEEPWSEELVKLIGGPLPDPLGHPAAPESAQKHGTPPAAGKQGVHRDAGAWAPKS